MLLLLIWFSIFESLQVRRSSLVQKTLPFYEVLNNEHPQYLFNLIPVTRTLYSTRDTLNISTIIEWNKLDPGPRKAESLQFSGYDQSVM